MDPKELLQSTLAFVEKVGVHAPTTLEQLKVVPKVVAYGFPVGSIFVRYVALMHAASNDHHGPVSLFHRWVAMIVLSFGGTTAAGWIASNDPLVVYTAVYLLFRYGPATRILRFFGRLSHVVLALGDGVARTLAITDFAVDGILATPAPNAHLRQSVVACLVCGTLSGCGGGLVSGMFGLTKRTWALGMPVVSFDVVIAFVIAAMYTATLKAGVDANAAKGLCIAVKVGALVLQALVKDIGPAIAARSPVEGYDQAQLIRKLEDMVRCSNPDSIPNNKKLLSGVGESSDSVHSATNATANLTKRNGKKGRKSSSGQGSD